MPQLSDFAGNTTVLSVPLGGTSAVMSGSMQFQLVGSVLSRSVYATMAATYPGQTMYYSMATSQNLTSTNPAVNNFTQLIYALGLYFGLNPVGDVYSAASLTSPWTKVSALSAISSMAFNGTTLVALNNATANPISYYSTNGTTWTSAATNLAGISGAYSTFKVVAVGAGNFVALSTLMDATARVYSGYSSDGANWTIVGPVSGIGSDYGQSLAVVATGTYVVGIPTSAGNSGTAFLVLSATGGAVATYATPSNVYYGIGAANSTNVVAIGPGKSNVAAYSSTPSTSFTATTMPVSAYWTSVSWNQAASLFVAVGNTAGAGGAGSTMVVATSPDGATWTQKAVVTDIAGLVSSCSANGTTILTGQGSSYNLSTVTPATAASYSILNTARRGSAGVAYSQTTRTFVQVGGVASNAAGYCQNRAPGAANALSWSTAVMPAVANWSACTWGNGTFAAIASDGNTAAYSTSDGLTWSAATLPSSAPWAALTYGAKFVAVAGLMPSTAAAYSADGVTWAAATLPSAQFWSSVAYGNGVYVAVAGSGAAPSTAAAYSTNDGATWTASTLPASLNWNCVAYGAGLFVAVATIGGTGGAYPSSYATSPDGINWTLRSFPAAPGSPYVTFGNGMFVVSGFSSVDGISWASRAGGPTVAAYGSGLFVAPGFQYFIDNAATSQYICITGTAGNLVRCK